MSRIFDKLFLVAAFVAISVASAQAETINFEGLGPGSQFILSTEGGFDFGTNNIFDTGWFYSDQAGSVYQPHSGSTFLATDASLYAGQSYEAAQAIKRSTPFVFDGAYFSGLSNIGYELYLDSNLVFSSKAGTSLSPSPIFVASGYNGAIDSVVIMGKQGYFALDDFTYHDVVTPVPEPTSWLLLILGFTAIGATLRRRAHVGLSFADV
jgi:hypothetical protein